MGERASQNTAGLPRRVYRFVADRWVLGVGLVVLAYMAAPVLVIILLSFNKPESKRTTYLLDGGITWSLENWTGIFDDPDIKNALVSSLLIGGIATAVATVLGTMIAFALVRHRFAGRSAVNLLIFLPMATPEIVMGSSLLALFVGADNIPVLGLVLSRIPLGFWTIVIAHVMFCISFVVVTVKARLAGLDPRLQEAATDLYATPFATFRQVTLPLVAPGIAAAALLSFSLSFDDYIITAFSSGSGSVVTFPLFVWGANQRGIPPEVNAIATAMFLVAFVIVAIGQIRNLRRAKRAATS